MYNCVINNEFILLADALITPCSPSPCGPNSHCQAINGISVCKCIEGFTGSPPLCRPECVVSSDCSTATACVNQRCRNPCLGSCGLSADCTVVNHNPICSCRQGLTGNPFQACVTLPSKLKFYFK